MSNFQPSEVTARGSETQLQDSMSESSLGAPSQSHSSSPQTTQPTSPKRLKESVSAAAAAAAACSSAPASRPATPASCSDPLSDGRLVINEDSVNMSERNGTVTSYVKAELEAAAPAALMVKTEDKGHPERKRRLSDESLDSSTRASESAADDPRDDDDDNDDDDEDKLTLKDRDPERLKAFNMFVRLFVDENLDRMVPISKQPKDKIQAILEACDRQFPEFHIRSRKRVRTYLKSCRRMRRTKDSNGWDTLRPTPPHLTSAAAEGILAHACENESANAKRMRMGLEPLPAKCMGGSTPCPVRQAPTPPISQPSSSHPSPVPAPPAPHPAISASSPSPSPAHAHVSPGAMERSAAAPSDYLRHSAAAAQPAAFRPPQEMGSPFFGGSNGLFRPGFPGTYPAHHHQTPLLSHTQLSSPLQNGQYSGPTDLSVKKAANGAASQQKNQLNPSEVATIKQLIAGYRESAAFLYRSADELEQLLLQQN